MSSVATRFTTEGTSNTGPSDLLAASGVVWGSRLKAAGISDPIVEPARQMIIVLAGLAILVTAGLVFMTIGAVRRGAVRRPLTHPIRDCLIIIEYPVHN